MRKQALYDHVLGYLGSIMDATETELNYTTPFELPVGADRGPSKLGAKLRILF